MTDIPHGLLSDPLERSMIVEEDQENEDWYVIPRPEGTRVLVISANGSTISRRESGVTLENFKSLLPNGSPKTRGGDLFCILDCIYRESTETYYVLDLMAWKGTLFYDCTTEFRLFWLHSKLQEDCESLGVVTSSNTRRIVPLPVFDSSLEGLQSAYTGIFEFPKDGLYFYNRAARYVCGINPLVRRGSCRVSLLLFFKSFHLTRSSHV